VLNDLSSWFAPGVDGEARHHFALNTCNGCHSEQEAGRRSCRSSPGSAARPGWPLRRPACDPAQGSAVSIELPHVVRAHVGAHGARSPANRGIRRISSGWDLGGSGTAAALLTDDLLTFTFDRKRMHDVSLGTPCDHRNVRLGPVVKQIACVLISVGLLGACRSGPAQLASRPALCSLVHSPASSQVAHAGDVCDGTVLPDLSELPAPLAGAGCIKLGTYQLGLARKSLRYAVCPAVPTDCRCPVRSPAEPGVCTTPLGRFVACFQAPDDGPLAGRSYGYARVVTSVCDACLGSSLPPGMVLVSWHEQRYCEDDGQGHNDRIEQATGATPPLPPPVGPSPTGGMSPQPLAGKPNPTCDSGCYGGCMAQGPPPAPWAPQSCNCMP
jgi:hypothetical protein